ncbi:MAG TPA: hypothetical protein VK548_15255 [Candidatus Acidoferrum sp.]|nr:hypothetical protein [Candidatus Acidoferrum sp.]
MPAKFVEAVIDFAEAAVEVFDELLIHATTLSAFAVVVKCGRADTPQVPRRRGRGRRGGRRRQEIASARARVPMAAMLIYGTARCSMTGGRGGYSMEFSHYEEVPAFIAEKVIKEAKAEKEKAEKH